MDDDEYSVFTKMPNSLGRGFAQRVETEAANCFNNGFTTFTGADGVAMFSTVHPKNPNESTTYITNTPAAAADLSVASLKAAITAFENQTDERGLKIAQRAKFLIVPADLDFTAQEILQSQLEPYIVENTKNVLNSRLTAVVWPFLTDADSWFMAADKADHTLNFWWRTKFTVKRDSDFNSWDARYAAFMRFGLGVEKGWLGLYGVQGA
jgi:phage major head subunit gpT-like protein